MTTTTTSDVADLRQRVRRMAEMHNQRGDHTMMGGRGAPAPGANAEHQHGGGAVNAVAVPFWLAGGLLLGLAPIFAWSGRRTHEPPGGREAKGKLAFRGQEAR